MKKNDITYEYRVFTNRLIDVDSMEVGNCTSKVIKEIKSKDKVDGRFFHTSDTDEWFYCWNGELQKLNLKGNSDVNAALAEVKKLIGEANAAVSEAKNIASEAKDAADAATKAAEDANAAVESIEGKADKSEVEKKADKSDVDAVSKAVGEKADKADVEDLSQKVNEIPSVKDIALKSDISGKQDVIADLATIRANAELGATAIQEIPDTYATKEYVGQQIDGINFPTVPTNVSEFINDAEYLTKDVADGYYAAIGTTGSGDGVDKNYVDTELAKKQNIINDIDDIRSKANSALQSIPEVYVTDEELKGKGYLTAHQDISGKQDVIDDLETIRSGAAAGATALQASDLNGYLTEETLANSNVIVEINSKIAEINTLLGDATALTNTILNA